MVRANSPHPMTHRFRSASRLCMKGFAVCFVFALLFKASAAGQKSKSNAGPASSGDESGSFRILFGGEPIGQEKFQISETSSGIQATAEVRLSIERERGKERVVFLLRPILSCTKNFEPTAYQVTQEDGVQKRSVRVVFKPGGKSERIYDAGSEHDSREIELKRDVLILDDNAFHHYILLSRRFDYVKGGVQEFTAFVPQQFLAGAVSISDKGKDTIKVGDRTMVLQQLLVDTGELQISLWLDDRHSLKRLIVPKSNVEVLREE
ncbi:MAG: hypothetical protein U0V70_18405 [Terriglobia bacterium]